MLDGFNSVHETYDKLVCGQTRLQYKNGHCYSSRGELPYEEYMGGVPPIRVIFSRKNSEKGESIFHKNSGKGYNISKKFQIGSAILMTQMTNQKKTELIDFFDLVWTKNPQFFPEQPSKSYFGDLH